MSVFGNQSVIERVITPEQAAVLDGFFNLATVLLEVKQAALYLCDYVNHHYFLFREYCQPDITQPTLAQPAYINFEAIKFSQPDNTGLRKVDNALIPSVPINVNGRLIGFFEASDLAESHPHINRKQVLALLLEQLTVNLTITWQLNNVLTDQWVDPVTRLPNGLYLEKRLETDLSYLTHRRTNIALIVLSLPNLVSFCNQAPHNQLWADKPLIEFVPTHIVKLIKSQLNEADLCVRFDTTNFGLLLANTHEIQAYRLAYRLHQLLKADDLLKETTGGLLELKFGISAFPHLAGDAKSLLTQATTAAQVNRKETRTNSQPIKIWKALPVSNMELLLTIEDLEVARAILQGFNYYPLPPKSYRRLNLKSVPLAFAQQNNCLPVRWQNEVLTVAMLNPSNQELVAQLAAMTGCHVLPVVTTHAELQAALNYLKHTILIPNNLLQSSNR